MKKNIALLFVVVLTLFALTACTGGKELTVSEVWARPGLADGNTGVFFEINNPTNQDDRLLSASSDIAGAVELHQTTMTDGVMKMTPQEFVAVPAGEKVIFKPGDFHIMLIGLTDDLNLGDSFEVTLNFEYAGEIVLQVSAQ